MARKKRSTKAKPKNHGRDFYKEALDPYAHLPGYLLIAFGLLALPLNFGLLGGMEWVKAWPLLLVLFGFSILAKVAICRSRLTN